MESVYQKFKKLDTGRGELNWPKEGKFTALVNAGANLRLQPADSQTKKLSSLGILAAKDHLKTASNDELIEWVTNAASCIGLREIDNDLRRVAQELRAKAQEYDQLVVLRKKRANSISEDMTLSEAKSLIANLREIYYENQDQTRMPEIRPRNS